MPHKKSQAEIAEFHEVDQSTISRLKAKGVDIYDDEAIQLALLTSQKPAPNIAPRIIAGGLTIADVETIDEAKFLKEVLLVKKESHNLSILEGKSISIGEVKEALQKIGNVTKSLLSRIPSQNSQILEGKEAKEIEKILDDIINQVLQEMHDEFEGMLENE